MKAKRDWLSAQTIERFGVWYIHRLAKRDERRKATRERNDHERLQAIRFLTTMSMVVAFLTGAITALVAVYYDRMFVKESLWLYFLVTGTATVLTTVIELFLLGWLSVYTAYHLARMAGLNLANIQEKAYLEEQMSQLLTRAALELPDPVHHFLGIDPLSKVSKNRLFVVGLVYKLKVFLSNVGARILLGKIVGSSMGKVSIFYVAVPITGLWDTIVVYRVCREANLRLFGSILARNVVEELLIIRGERPISPLVAEGCIRAIANSVVLTQKNHPNMLLLLYQAYHALSVPELDQPDSWEAFKAILPQVSRSERRLILDLLCISAAFDGYISALERELLGDAFGEWNVVYFYRIRKITAALRSGKLEEAGRWCRFTEYRAAEF